MFRAISDILENVFLILSKNSFGNLFYEAQDSNASGNFKN